MDAENYSVDNVLKYLDENLIKSHRQQSKELFQKTFTIIWESTLQALWHFVKVSIEVN